MQVKFRKMGRDINFNSKIYRGGAWRPALNFLQRKRTQIYIRFTFLLLS